MLLSRKHNLLNYLEFVGYSPRCDPRMAILHVQVQGDTLSIKAREALRRALAASAGRQVSRVAIESMSSRTKAGPGTTVTLSVAMDTDALAAQNLVTALLVCHDVLSRLLTNASTI